MELRDKALVGKRVAITEQRGEWLYTLRVSELSAPPAKNIAEWHGMGIDGQPAGRRLRLKACPNGH